MPAIDVSRPCLEASLGTGAFFPAVLLVLLVTQGDALESPAVPSSIYSSMINAQCFIYNYIPVLNAIVFVITLRVTLLRVTWAESSAALGNWTDIYEPSHVEMARKC